MPCRVDLFRCAVCGGEHYYEKECLTDPTKRGEGLPGYNPKIASLDTKGALCDVLTSLKDKGLLDQANVSKDILDWWGKHQAAEGKK